MRRVPLILYLWKYHNIIGEIANISFFSASNLIKCYNASLPLIRLFFLFHSFFMIIIIFFIKKGLRNRNIHKNILLFLLFIWFKFQGSLFWYSLSLSTFFIQNKKIYSTVLYHNKYTYVHMCISVCMIIK